VARVEVGPDGRLVMVMANGEDDDVPPSNNEWDILESDNGTDKA
jgi:hypothetical protein